MDSRRKRGNEDQISLFDMTLKTGDKLYRDGSLYGEIAGESESLYFVMKTNSKDNMPIPYKKENLRNSILMGKLTLEMYNYD